MLVGLSIALLTFIVVASWRVFSPKSRLVRTIRGPINPSFLLGHEQVLRLQDNAGDLEMPWFKEFGSVVRVAGSLGQDILLISDPKTLQYIFHTSGYRYPRPTDQQHVSDLIFGPGLTTAFGAMHQRQRRILGPGFGAEQLRSFLEVFQTTAGKLNVKLRRQLDEGDGVIDILSWTGKTALDIIGVTSFRYKFNSLDGSDDDLSRAMNNLFGEAQMDPAPWMIVYSTLWRLFPAVGGLLRLVEKFPTREQTRLRQFNDTSKATALGIVNKAIQEEVSGAVQKGEKDIVGLLASSALTTDEKKKMDQDEIMSQMATFILAGHDTTAASIAWLFYELAKHPVEQARLRAEINTLRETRPGVLSAADYDSLPYLNACIKETLRFHPFVHSLLRWSVEEDVLPLSEPIATVDGKVLNEIPIPKGQVIMASLYCYNHLTSVWGEDAGVWNPDRFLNDKLAESQIPIGVYANLLTFSAGIRGCLGWRFAVLEMQAVSTSLIEAFEFGLPEGGLDLVQSPTQLTTFPAIRGKLEDGSKIPLRIKSLR